MTDVEDKNEWKNCFDVAGVRLPTGYFFGASAGTGDLSGERVFSLLCNTNSKYSVILAKGLFNRMPLKKNELFLNLFLAYTQSHSEVLWGQLVLKQYFKKSIQPMKALMSKSPIWHRSLS